MAINHASAETRYADIMRRVGGSVNYACACQLNPADAGVVFAARIQELLCGVIMRDYSWCAFLCDGRLKRSKLPAA